MERHESDVKRGTKIRAGVLSANALLLVSNGTALQRALRVTMLMSRHRGAWGKAPDVDTALGKIQSAILLDVRMMRTLFPDATIHRERIIGFIKSLIAIRSTTEKSPLVDQDAPTFDRSYGE